MIKKIFRRLFRWTLGLLFLPFLWAAGVELGRLILSISAQGWRSWWIYATGGLVYFLIERVVGRPMWVYVFGHEVTHAFSGFISGAKIHSFKASSNGGEVKLSKSNGFIALSPYILPIYSMLIILFYAALKNWWPSPWLTYGFQFLMGSTVTFHVSLTFSAFHKRQSDLNVLGFFLSGVLILLGNALILGLLCVSLFKGTPSISRYLASLGKDSWVAWKQTAASLVWCAQHGPTYFSEWSATVKSWIR